MSSFNDYLKSNNGILLKFLINDGITDIDVLFNKMHIDFDVFTTLISHMISKHEIIKIDNRLIVKDRTLIEQYCNHFSVNYKQRYKQFIFSIASFFNFKKPLIFSFRCDNYIIPGIIFCIWWILDTILCIKTGRFLLIIDKLAIHYLGLAILIITGIEFSKYLRDHIISSTGVDISQKKYINKDQGLFNFLPKQKRDDLTKELKNLIPTWINVLFPIIISLLIILVDFGIPIILEAPRPLYGFEPYALIDTQTTLLKIHDIIIMISYLFIVSSLASIPLIIFFYIQFIIKNIHLFNNIIEEIPNTLSLSNQSFVELNRFLALWNELKKIVQFFTEIIYVYLALSIFFGLATFITFKINTPLEYFIASEPFVMIICEALLTFFFIFIVILLIRSRKLNAILKEGKTKSRFLLVNSLDSIKDNSLSIMISVFLLNINQMPERHIGVKQTISSLFGLVSLALGVILSFL